MTTWLSRLHTLLGGAKTAPAGERRMSPRYKQELPVTIVAHDRVLHARSCDISQTGVGLILNGELEIGEEVFLQYTLGDGSPPKKVRSIVRNHTGSRYGMEFAD